MKPATLEPQASADAPARLATTRRSAHARAEDSAEPRTGVVRKVEARDAAAASAGERREKRSFESGVVRRAVTEPPNASTEALDRAKSRAWRCLEWAAVPDKAPSVEPPAPRVSIAQLTTQGELMRQSGPNEALPETAGFMHRIATLIAQDLGFNHCRALCLRGPESALSIARAGATKVVGVTGPLSDMGNVLRRMNLE